MLAVAIVYLHYVVEGCMEEGKLAKHHCGGDIAWESQCSGLAGCGGARGGDGGLLALDQEEGSYKELLVQGPTISTVFCCRIST